MNQQASVTVLLLGIILLAAVIITWSVVRNAQDSADTPFVQTNSSSTSAVLDLAFSTVEGTALNLRTEQDELYILFSWASWCPQCTDQLQSLTELAETHIDTPITFAAINRAESLRLVTSYLNSVTPWLLDSPLTILLDENDSFYQTVNGQAMPEIFVLSSEGAVIRRFQNQFDVTVIENIITQELVQ